MNKLLAKFYYILASNGLLVDYRLPQRDGDATDAGEAGAQPEEPQDDAGEDGAGDGTIDTGAGSVGR